MKFELGLLKSLYGTHGTGGAAPTAAQFEFTEEMARAFDRAPEKQRCAAAGGGGETHRTLARWRTTMRRSSVLAQQGRPDGPDDL